MTSEAQPVEHARAPIAQALSDLLEQVRGEDHGGAVADYIPELAKADPNLFGIAASTVFGRTYATGDTTHEFTIQSISKAFVYALVVDEHGIDDVRSHVGVEPSGAPFNAISFDSAGRPMNPMINLGAITATSLLGQGGADERFDSIRLGLSRFAGRGLQLDEAVYRSEASTGDRNHALGSLSRAEGMLRGAVDDVVDAYFRQCSVLVNVTDLAVMASTLAAGGVNPVTGDRVVGDEAARHTLSVMSSSGMYDRSGDWMVDVGMPAKSGVGGGIVAITPGKFGIGVFSPPLDAVGNSARGVAALKHLAHEFGFHPFARSSVPVSPIEAIDADDTTHRVTVHLRGELDFVAMERVAVELQRVLPWYDTGELTVTLDGVTQLNPIAARALHRFTTEAARNGFACEFRDPNQLLGLS
ncbi:glutaminase A [Microbacterium amylolyticum]|uniref:Glutaminase n=1 Tax=Microbacterium amylolyticum TaxID=936337 RepID=A0ABS4ZKH4_9MICO|nr:glutaminase A [Microbacterium amylolyticum]MBP2437789.1 glutaminase [Microbacterium amylolyticum]